MLTLCGIAYCGSMLDILRNYKNSNYNSMAEVTANSFSNTIQDECTIIQNYSNEISKFEYENINTYLVRGYLENMAKYNKYSNIYIVNSQGKGFDYLDQKIDVSKQDFFSNIDFSNQSIVCQDESIVYITPTIDENSQFKFFIIAERPVKLSISKIAKENWNDAGFYILDSSDNIIAYDQDDTSTVTYNQLIDYGVIYTYNEDLISDVTDISLQNFMENIRNFILPKDNPPVVWYKHSININDWSILIGRSTINQDKDIIAILAISIKMLGVILSTQVLVLIDFMIMNTINKYNLKKALFLDTVTGGTNWLKFKNDASRELKKGKKRYALVSFDIYKFRVFCDINGHKLGDEALIEVDKLMSKFIRRKEYYAHNTFDTFDMLLIYKDETSLCERLKAFSSQLALSEKLSSMRFAFGIYAIDNKNISINRMSIMANMSKDNDKLQDFTLKETISFFTKDMHDKTIKETEIFNSFADAIQNEQFLLFIQPKYDLMNETLSAGEALVRWNKNDDEFISPAEFIPVFEKMGCIRELDKYMLEAVCKKQRQWLDEGLEIVPISVNLSRACFSDKSLAKSILRLVDSYKLPHDMVELEVTESAFFDNKGLLIDTVKKLRSFGFSVSIDDFGAGYSSLNSLKELPIDVLKLDSGFFRNTDDKDTKKANTIVYNTIKLAYDLNLKIVAEGVETQEQIDFLRSLGYNMLIQSYYYSKPLPNSEFVNLLHKETPLTLEASNEQT